MIKKLLLVTIGLILLLVMILVALPAKLIVNQNLLPPALKIDGVSGRWWSGQAASVTWYGQPRGRLNWQFSFPDNVAFSLNNGINEIRSEAKLAPLLSGQQQAVFQAVKGQLQASELPLSQSLNGVSLHGELVFNLSELRATRNQQLNLNGNVIWHQARLSGSVALDLGQVDIHLSPQAEVTNLKLSNNNSGDVLITGAGTFAVDHYDLKLHLRAGFGKDQLRKQLSQIGELNPDGSITLALEGDY